MKTLSILPSMKSPVRFVRVSELILTLVCLLSLTHSARADDIDLHFDIAQANDPDGIVRYYAYPYLTANPLPLSFHSIRNSSGQIRSSLSSAGSTFGLSGGAFFSIDEVINQFTNGLWTLVINSNDASQQTYTFAVTITNLDTNTWPRAVIFTPLNGSMTEPNHPNYFWNGPTNWTDFHVNERSEDFSYYYTEYLDVTSTNWPDAPSLPFGSMEFEVNYGTADTPMFQIMTPTNGGGSLANWTSDVLLQTYAVHNFTVPVVPSSGHQLVAHYAFDTTNNLGEVDVSDSSGNGNDINGSSSWGLPLHEFSTDAAVGTGAALFHGWDALAPPDAVVQSLSGSFTVSAWIKTTQSVGNSDDPGNFGVGIITAGIGDNDSIPIALTGDKAAFYTGNAGGDVDTLHSTNDINTGDYVHIVVTRRWDTGEKRIYVNGVLENTDTGITAPLDTPQNQFDLYLGGAYGTGLDGLLDDVQFYTGVLSDSEVAQLYNNPGMTIPDSTSSPIVAHYDFDDDSNLYPLDVSGNGYDMNKGFGFGTVGGFGGFQFNSTAEAGAHSMEFYKAAGNPNSGGVLSWNPMPTNIMSALAGNFSISIWIKTTNNTANAGNSATAGAAIVSADVPGSANDIIPLALTGGHAAFGTGGSGGDDTLTSANAVNDNQWHHIVVTRDQQTGEKKMYIDGLEDDNSPQTGSTDLLNDPHFLTIGMRADASASDADSAGYYPSSGYEGLLDDLQIYPRVINASDVDFLYMHPGTELSSGSGGPLTLAEALDNTNLVWSTGGDAPWIPETNETYDGQDAAQSGAIGDDQESWVETTVPYDGHLTFWWKVSSEQDADYLSFSVNGFEEDYISGEDGWWQDDFYVSAGDVLRWTYYKDSSGTNGQDRAWLDKVQFMPEVDASITLSIVRRFLPGDGERYYAAPFLSVSSPDLITSNRVESPNNMFSGVITTNGNSSFAGTFVTLDEVINECTNGMWKLYINKGDPSQQLFYFEINIANLTTNLLSAINILAPTNGATGVATNVAFQWSGPVGFSSLYVQKSRSDFTESAYANLSATATNWPGAPTLSYGTNRFFVQYTTNNFPNITFSTPADVSFNEVSSWSASAQLVSQSTAIFVVEPSATPIQIINPTVSGNSISFGFQTLSGKLHTIEAKTNLVGGTWMPLTNFMGDGNMKQFTFPTTNPPTFFFHVKTE